MLFSVIIFIIFLVCIYNANEQILALKKENKRLKQELAYLKNQEKDNIEQSDIQNKEKIRNENIIRQEPILVQKEENILTQEEKEKIILKREKEAREKRNTTILITGAILIVLSAIVFLMSTWYAISDVLKTLVLVLLVGVFLGGSKIAKEKFQLEKTSNTFFYIAMAYIPICLFSISFLGLLGNFLSLNGEGSKLYLTISGIVTSLIYFVVYKNTNNKIIFYGSILSQVFSVVLFSLIFDNRLEIISLNLLLYNILFILLTFETNNQHIKSIKYIYNFLPYVATFMTYASFGSRTILIPFNFLVLAINYLILEKIENRRINAYLFNIVISSFGIHLIWEINNNFSDSINVLSTVLYTLLVYIIENIILIRKNKKDFKIASYVITLVTLQIIFMEFYNDITIFIKPYIISAIQCIILLISYIQSKEKGKKITSFLVPIYFITTGLVLLDKFDLSYHYYIIFSLITFVIGELLQGKEVIILKKGFFTVSNIFLILIYLLNYIVYDPSKISVALIYFILLLIVYMYSYIKYQKSIFKYASYCISMIVLYCVFEIFNIVEKIGVLIPIITLIIAINLENKFTKLKDNKSEIFLNVLKILSYCCLGQITDIFAVITSIGLTVYLLYYYRNDNTYSNLIPLIGVMPTIFENSLEYNLEFFIMMLATVGITAISFKNKKINMYTIFSGIYLFFTLTNQREEYVNEILFIIWAFCNWYFIEKPKEKDVFKFLLYLGGLSLYNKFAEELDLTYYTAFSMLGYIVIVIATIRTILKKYMKSENIDTIEAISFIFLYLSAIGSYNGEYDGMLFGILIVAIILFSYVKKYGVLFLTSVGAILINMFLLTRVFWFSIPWWVYLLIIGSVLIAFAVKNEANEKNNKFNISDTLKNLKDKIEK